MNEYSTPDSVAGITAQKETKIQAADAPFSLGHAPCQSMTIEEHGAKLVAKQKASAEAVDALKNVGYDTAKMPDDPPNPFPMAAGPAQGPDPLREEKDKFQKDQEDVVIVDVKPPPSIPPTIITPPVPYTEIPVQQPKVDLKRIRDTSGTWPHPPPAKPTTAETREKSQPKPASKSPAHSCQNTTNGKCDG